MSPEQMKAALMASTEAERKYVLGPMFDGDLSGDFPVDEAAVTILVDEANDNGRLGQLRFRMYEFGLIKAALLA